MMKQVICSVALMALASNVVSKESVNNKEINFVTIPTEQIIEREPINKEGISRDSYEINLPTKEESKKIDKVCAMNKLSIFSETLKEKHLDYRHVNVLDEHSEQFKKLKTSDNLILYKHNFDYIIYLDMKNLSIYYSKQLGSKAINQWVLLEQDTLRDCISKQ